MKTGPRKMRLDSIQEDFRNLGVRGWKQVAENGRGMGAYCERGWAVRLRIMMMIAKTKKSINSKIIIAMKTSYVISGFRILTTDYFVFANTTKSLRK